MSSNAAIQAGKAVITVGLDPKGIDRGIADMSRQLKGLSTAFREVGFEVTALSGAISYGLVKALKLLDRPIRISAHIESATISFEVLTGSAQMAINTVKELRAFAAVSPLKFEGMAQATETLLAYGVSARRVMKDIKLLGQASRGDQTRLSRLALAYGQVAAKGRLYASEMRQFTESGFNPLQIMVEKTGVSMGSLLKRMEQGQVSFEDVRQSFIDATSAGGRFFGLLEKQGQSLGGVFNRMVDAIEQAVQPIGDALAEPIKEIMFSVMQAARSLREFLVENHNLVRGVVGGTVVLTAFAAAATGVGISMLAIGAAGRIFSTVLKTVSYFSKVSFKATAAQMDTVSAASSNMSAGIVTATTEATAAIKVLEKAIKGVTVGMANEMRKLEAAFVKGFAKSTTAVRAFAAALTIESVKASKALTASLGSSFAVLQPTVRAAMTKAGESYKFGWDRIHLTSRTAATKLRNGLANAFTGLSKSTVSAMKGVERAYISGWSAIIKYSKTGGSLLQASFKLALMKMPATMTKAMTLVERAYVKGWSSINKQSASSGALLRASFKATLVKLPETMALAMAKVDAAYVKGWGVLVKSTTSAGKPLLTAFKAQMKGLKAVVAEAMLSAKAAYIAGWEKMAASSAAGGKLLTSSIKLAFKGASQIVAVEMAAINASVASSITRLGEMLVGVATATNAAIAAKTAELQTYAVALRTVVAEIGGATTAINALSAQGAAASGASGAGAAGAATPKGRGKKKAAEESDFLSRLNAAIATAKSGPEEKKRGTPKGTVRGPYKKRAPKAVVAEAIATTATMTAIGVAEVISVADKAPPQAAQKAVQAAQTVSTQRRKRKKPGLKPRPENLARLQAEATELKRLGLFGASAEASQIPTVLGTSRNKRGFAPGVNVPSSDIFPQGQQPKYRPNFVQYKPPKGKRPGTGIVPFDPAFADRQMTDEMRYLQGIGLASDASTFFGPGGRDDVQAKRAEQAAARAAKENNKGFRTSNRAARNRSDVEFPSQVPKTTPVTGPMNFNQPLTRKDELRGRINRLKGLNDPRGFDQLVSGIATKPRRAPNAFQRQSMTGPLLPAPMSPLRPGVFRRVGNFGVDPNRAALDKMFADSYPMTLVPPSPPPVGGQVPPKTSPKTKSKMNPKTFEKQRRRLIASLETVNREDPTYMRQFQADQKKRRVAGLMASAPPRLTTGQKVGGAVRGMVDMGANKTAAKTMAGAAGGGAVKATKAIGSAAGAMLTPFTMVGGLLKALLVPAAIFAAKIGLVVLAVGAVVGLFATAAKRAGVFNEIVGGVQKTFAGVYGWVSKVVTTLFQAAKMGEFGAMLSYAFAEAKYGFLVFVQSMLQMLPQVVDIGTKLFISMAKTIVDIFLQIPALIWNTMTGLGKAYDDIIKDIITGNSMADATGEGSAIDKAVKNARGEADRQKIGIGARSDEKKAKSDEKAAKLAASAAAAEAENTRIAEREEAAARDLAERNRRKDMIDAGVSSFALGMDPETLASNQKSAKDRLKSLFDENVAIIQAARGNKNYLDVINGVSSAMISATNSASDLNEALKQGQKLDERIEDARSSTFAVFDGGAAKKELDDAFKAIFDADLKNFEARKEAANLNRSTAGYYQSDIAIERQRLLNEAVATTGAASQTARDNFDKLNEALRAEKVLAYAETIKTLDDEIEALRIGADAAERRRLERQGYTPEEIASIEARKAEKKALEEAAAAKADLERRAGDIKEDIKSPEQKLREAQDDIAKMILAGFLDVEEAAAAFAKNVEEYNRRAEASYGKSGFSGARTGSRESREAIRMALADLPNAKALQGGRQLAQHFMGIRNKNLGKMDAHQVAADNAHKRRIEKELKNINQGVRMPRQQVVMP